MLHYLLLAYCAFGRIAFILDLIDLDSDFPSYY